MFVFIRAYFDPKAAAVLTEGRLKDVSAARTGNGLTDLTGVRVERHGDWKKEQPCSAGWGEGSCRFSEELQRKSLPSLAMDAAASLLRHTLRNSAGSCGWEHTAPALDSTSLRLHSASSPLKSFRRALTDSSGKRRSPSCSTDTLTS